MIGVRYQEEIDKENKKKILQVIYAENGTDWKRLKEETGFADSVLAKHIKELEKTGLIRTEIDEVDRRKKKYYINEEGIKQIAVEIYGGVIVFTKLLASIDPLRLDETAQNIGYIVLANMLGGQDSAKACGFAVEELGRILSENEDKRIKRISKRVFKRSIIKLMRRKRNFYLRASLNVRAVERGLSLIKISKWWSKECKRRGFKREEIFDCFGSFVKRQIKLSPLTKAYLGGKIKLIDETFLPTLYQGLKKLK